MKMHRRTIRNIRVANANTYADHRTDSVISCHVVRGKVEVWGKWYLYYRDPQDFYRKVKPRSVGKVIRMLARNRLVRDLAVSGCWIK